MYQGPWKTRRIGRQVIYLPEASSTNSEALRLARLRALTDGNVVIAGHQTGGRGQGSNRWLTEPGLNLTLSVYLEKPVVPEDLFLLNIVASLAVCDALRLHLGGIPVQVKWPNDVYAGGLKIAGILIESSIQGSIIQYAVCGIGLNVNQLDFPVPAATSIAMCTGKESDLEKVFGDLLTALDHQLEQLASGNHQRLRNSWLENLFLKDVHHRFRTADGEVEGIIRGIDDAGRLLLETKEGIRMFMQKELIY